MRNYFLLLLTMFLFTGCIGEYKLHVKIEDYPTKLTEEEKRQPLAKYYYNIAEIPSQIENELIYKNKSRAVEFENINEVLSDDKSKFENGYTRLNDNSGYVAVNTKFPGATAEMLDWWFEWVGYDSLRYKIWYPGLHSQALYEGDHPNKDYEYSITNAVYRYPDGKTKHTIEAIAEDGKLSNLYITFVNPEQFGIDSSLLGNDQWAIAAVVKNGSIEVAKMVHFLRKTEDGIEMRSRFWMGMDLPGFLKKSAAKDEQLYNMAYHCAQEYNQLASFIVEVYNEYK